MKRIGIFIVLVVMLAGCAKKETPPVHRVVTGVQVEYRQGDRTLHRSYSQPESIHSILNYLRILKPFGPVIPEAGDGSGCRITLHFSHGPDSVYLQQGTSYLCRNGGDWESIDSTRATLLYPMLLLLPSDA